MSNISSVMVQINSRIDANYSFDNKHYSEKKSQKSNKNFTPYSEYTQTATAELYLTPPVVVFMRFGKQNAFCLIRGCFSVVTNLIVNRCERYDSDKTENSTRCHHDTMKYTGSSVLDHSVWLNIEGLLGCICKNNARGKTGLECR